VKYHQSIQYDVANQSLSPRLHLRAERERILRRYDVASLAVAYKITFKLPLSQDVGHLTPDAMINAILDAEYGNGTAESEARRQSSLCCWADAVQRQCHALAGASWTAAHSTGML
jgi:hypothetical protein